MLDLICYLGKGLTNKELPRVTEIAPIPLTQQMTEHMENNTWVHQNQH